MCGIAGIIGGHETGSALSASAARMKHALRHRGPDGEGIFIDEKAAQPVALAHRRLAIIDPAAGIQPMLLEEAGFALVFNGAIYNHLELRQELVARGHQFRTHSDTEVILHAYREWDTACVEHFNGMFAFGLWDAKRSRLFCARDRVGVKPFYFKFDGERFLFASEIKGILAVDPKPVEACNKGLADYLTFQFTMGEKTLFKDIHKLEPAHRIIVDVKPSGLKMNVQRYWSLDYRNHERLSEEETVEKLRFLIENAVRLCLRADVPVGVYLSGGLDSSAVAGIAADLMDIRFKTFTGTFAEGKEFDETRYAHIVAQHAGTEQHDITIRGADFATTMPGLIYYMDEPAAGPGLYPQYFVSKRAAKDVKVCLGGQGGDELFIGYARYLVATLEQCLKQSIYGGGAPGDITLQELTPSLPMLAAYKPMMQQQWRNGLFGDLDERYFSLVDRRDGNGDVFRSEALNGDYNPFTQFTQIFDECSSASPINRMLHFDMRTSLPALLHVEDRASMAASLESRVPLLDHHVVEFMASVPTNMKFAHGEMKRLFRKAIHRHVPETVLNRTDKMGFPVPLEQWVKGEAKDFVADTLLSERAQSRGLYHMDAVKRAVDGEGKFGRAVWGLLCLELWHREFVDGEYRARLAA